MGVDRILLASQSEEQASELDVFVVVADDVLRGPARILTSDLRRVGLRVDMTDMQRSVKAQFKEADRRKARSAVVIGSEWTEGEVTIKDLGTGDQQVIAAKEIQGWLRA